MSRNYAALKTVITELPSTVSTPAAPSIGLSSGGLGGGTVSASALVSLLCRKCVPKLLQAVSRVRGLSSPYKVLVLVYPVSTNTRAFLTLRSILYSLLYSTVHAHTP